MKALVLYDSTLGNTKTIAETIAKEIGNDTNIIAVSDFSLQELEGIDLLIVGSPINIWRPSRNIINFLASLNNGQLRGIKAAAFDTRLKSFMSGDASKKISKKLKRASADIIIEPIGFFVKGPENSLLDGEVEKAAAWAKSIKVKVV